MAPFFFDVEKISHELGLERLPTGKREEVLTELEEIISTRINVAVLERLTEDEQAHFINLVNEHKEDEALAYVQNQVLDLPELVRRVAREAVEEFLYLKDNQK